MLLYEKQSQLDKFMAWFELLILNRLAPNLTVHVVFIKLDFIKEKEKNMQANQNEITTWRIMISLQDLFRLSNIVTLMKWNEPLI